MTKGYSSTVSTLNSVLNQFSSFSVVFCSLYMNDLRRFIKEKVVLSARKPEEDADLVRKPQEYDSQLETLQAELQQKAQEIDFLQDDLAECKTLVAQLKEANAFLNYQLNSAIAQTQDLEKALRLANPQAKLPGPTSPREGNTQLELVVQYLERENESLTSQASDQRLRFDQLVRQTTQQENVHSKLRFLNASLKTEVEHLHQKLAQTDQALTAKDEALASAFATIVETRRPSSDCAAVQTDS